jgi:hypothetical protein
MVQRAQAAGPAPKQGGCTAEVPALGVGDADRQLGQALPQRSLVV